MKLCLFDIDGTLVDSNELHVDSWDRAFRHFGKEFPREKLRAQIGKGSDQYLPEFLTPNEIKRFGKELDDYRSDVFRKEYLPKVRPFPKVRELFERIHEDDKRIVLGIRPEAFEGAAAAPPGTPAIEVTPAVVEELGSDAHVFFPVEAATLAAAAEEGEDEATLLAHEQALFSARVDPRVPAAVGAPLTLAVDPARFHFFDLETGFSLLAGETHAAEEPLPQELANATQ